MRFSTPRLLLQLEGLVVLLGTCVLYARLGFSWTWFGALLLAPDLSMLGFLVNARVGAACYNAAHTYAGPALLLALLMSSHATGSAWLVLIWAAHIGMDRFVGYGLKYPADFKQTHLQRM